MDETRDDMGIFKIAKRLSQLSMFISCVRNDHLQVIVSSEDIGRDRRCEVVSKFILVSTFDVLLAWRCHSRSSLPTDFECPPSASHGHNQSCFREATRGESWSRPRDMLPYLGRRTSIGTTRPSWYFGDVQCAGRYR